MHRERGKGADDIYQNIGNDDDTAGTFGKETSELPGSDSVRNRISRAAPVCLVLLCVLLLTAVVVLSVHVHYTDGRIKKLNSTKLQMKFDQVDGWIYYQSSFYYMPNETNNWTESRRYCTERGADLIIINNRDEQDFVKNTFSGTSAYIGLTDSEMEGRWKWVDGSNMSSGFWGTREPDGRTAENCAMTMNHDPSRPNKFGWCDVACNRYFQWICEKSISQFILPKDLENVGN